MEINPVFLALQRFQHQLAAKHQAFYSATRLGRNLKDRCTKADPERDVLQQMLDELKNKWNAVRSVVSRRSVVTVNIIMYMYQ